MQAEGGGMRLPTFASKKMAYLCWMDEFVMVYETGRALRMRFFHQPWILSEEWEYIAPADLPELQPVASEVYNSGPKGSYRPDLKDRQQEMKARRGK